MASRLLTATAVAVASAGCAHASAGGSDGVPTGPRAGASSERCTSAPTTRAPFELLVLGSGGPRGFGRAASSYFVLLGGKAC